MSCYTAAAAGHGGHQTANAAVDGTDQKDCDAARYHKIVGRSAAIEMDGSEWSLPTGLKERYYSPSLRRRARASFVEFQAASPADKQHPHFQQVL